MAFEVHVRRPERPIEVSAFTERFEVARLGWDGRRWLTHPVDGDPFCAVEHVDGEIHIHVSYGSPRFIRNAIDAIQLGVRLATALEAEVFEEVGGTVLRTEAELDRLVVPDGEYVAQLGATFRAIVQQVHNEGRTPLEYPVGPYDLVSEVLAIQLRPASPPTAAAIEGALERVGGVKRGSNGEQWLVTTRVSGPSSWQRLTGGAAQPEPLAKVMRFPDQRIQAWPFYGPRPFAEVGPAVIDAILAVRGAAGGGLLTLGKRPLPDDEIPALRAAASGLVVDLWRHVSQPSAGPSTEGSGG